MLISHISIVRTSVVSLIIWSPGCAYIATDATMPRDSHEYVRVSAATRTTMNDEEGVRNGVRFKPPAADLSRARCAARSPINVLSCAYIVIIPDARFYAKQAGGRARTTRSTEEVTLEKVDTRAIIAAGSGACISLSAWLSSIEQE